ncbi:MAG TPA: hypothetical protein VHI52_19525, partial [Verrucomicrobiae bacterium]|nr:hypothetical protein [Verrucomicrobiae bacterium]
TKQLRALEDDPMISEMERRAQARALLQQAVDNASALLPPHYLTNYFNAGGNWIGGLLRTYGP